MNAYEMADKVDQRYAWLETKELSNMLRKQADRIAEFEKVKTLTDEEIYEIWEQFNGEIKNFAREILKKAQEK